jgi:hypothetical protein
MRNTKNKLKCLKRGKWEISLDKNQVLHLHFKTESTNLTKVKRLDQIKSYVEAKSAVEPASVQFLVCSGLESSLLYKLAGMLIKLCVVWLL